MKTALLSGAVVVLFAIHVYLGWQREASEAVYFGWIPRPMAFHLVWALAGAAVLIALLRNLWPRTP